MEWHDERHLSSSHWSTRRLAHLGVNHMMVARVWKRARLQPHRLAMVQRSRLRKEGRRCDRPLRDPPQHAVVFSIDKKTAIQALETRTGAPAVAGTRRTSPTATAYAATSGEVIGKTASRHTSAAFFRCQPRTREIHLIADNLSLTRRVRDFLASHPLFISTTHRLIHPAQSGPRQDRADASRIFTSVADRKLMRYIRHHNKEPRPIKWAYTNHKKRLLVPNQLLRSTSSRAEVVIEKRCQHYCVLTFPVGKVSLVGGGDESI